MNSLSILTDNNKILVSRKRTAFLDDHRVSDLVLILLIMSLIALVDLVMLAVLLVRNITDDINNNGLIHFVGYYLACELLSCFWGYIFHKNLIIVRQRVS